MNHLTVQDKKDLKDYKSRKRHVSILVIDLDNKPLTLMKNQYLLVQNFILRENTLIE